MSGHGMEATGATHRPMLQSSSLSSPCAATETKQGGMFKRLDAALWLYGTYIDAQRYEGTLKKGAWCEPTGKDHQGEGPPDSMQLSVHGVLPGASRCRYPKAQRSHMGLEGVTIQLMT